jgi:hypothetical protein
MDMANVLAELRAIEEEAAALRALVQETRPAVAPAVVAGIMLDLEQARAILDSVSETLGGAVDAVSVIQG